MNPDMLPDYDFSSLTDDDEEYQRKVQNAVNIFMQVRTSGGGNNSGKRKIAVQPGISDLRKRNSALSRMIRKEELRISLLRRNTELARRLQNLRQETTFNRNDD